MTENQSLHDLILQVQNGDPIALDAVYTRIGPRLFKFIRSRFSSTLTKEDVEDVVHNTIVKVQSHAHQYRGPNAQAWINSIAKREAYHMVQAIRKLPYSLDDLSHETDGEEDRSTLPEESPLLRDPDWEGEDTVEDRAIRSGAMKDVRRKADQLSADEQEVLRQRYDEKATYDEIGRRMGRSKVRAKQKHDGALSKIRKILRFD